MGRKKTGAASEKSRERRRAGLYITLVFFASVFLIYIATLLLLFPYMPVIARQAENIPGYDTHYPPFRVDEYNYYAIARNILEGRLYEGESLERGYPAGFAFVAAPFVAVLGPLGGYVANACIMWACLVLFYVMSRRYAPRGRSLFLTGLLAFTTLNWFYAASCYTEPLSQLLVLGALFLLTAGGDLRKRGVFMFAAGFVLSLNLFVRPHYILLAAPFFLYLLLRHGKKPAFDHDTLLFAGGAAAVGAMWMLRNTAVFGGPITFEYSRLVGSYIPGAASSYMKGNPLLGIHRLLFDQYHGLFTITPVLLLFPAGLRSMWLSGLKRESILLLASVVIMALFAASSAYPFTEFGLGSRHMLPVIPLMVLPAAFFLDGRLFSRSVVTVLAVYSFYHAGIGWFTGGEPGMGFFIGILNEAQSRAIILARKGMLPKKRFSSREELIEAYLEALKEANLMKLLQTMDPLVIEKIRGNERTFMIFLRSQPNPVEYILSADPEKGIIIKSFSISKGLTGDEAQSRPDSTSHGE